MNRQIAERLVREKLAELQGADDSDMLLAREKFIAEIVELLAPRRETVAFDENGDTLFV